MLDSEWPTISVGGESFYDIASIVTPNRDDRRLTDGLAIHHTVTRQHVLTFDAELGVISAINNYHIQQGYGGFGYNAIGFESGRVYVVGDGLGRRAHVAYENGHLEGFAMVGDYSYEPVPIGILLGAGRWLLAKFRQRGLVAVRPHREWVSPQHAAEGWATSCCGDEGVTAIPGMLMVAAALNRAGQ